MNSDHWVYYGLQILLEKMTSTLPQLGSMMFDLFIGHGSLTQVFLPTSPFLGTPNWNAAVAPAARPKPRKTCGGRSTNAPSQ